MASPSPPMQSFSLISTSLVVTSIVFVVLATVSVILRFYARRIKSLKFLWDDWTILISLFLSWVYTINTLVTAGVGGVDKTRTSLSPLAAAELFLRCLWIEGFPLGICLATIKISILLFYRRIFITKTFRWCVNVMVAVLIGWAISTVITQVFAAEPISGAWNPKATKLRYNYNAFALAVAGMSIVFDMMVLCFPLPIIRNLHMPTRRKVFLAGIFWLGGFCCVAAAVRFYLLYKGNRSVVSTNGNQYQYATNEFIWAHIEPNCSIVAACLPTYGPFFASNSSLTKWVGSLRTFVSYGINRSNKSYVLRSSSDPSGRGGMGSDSGLVMDRKRNRYWQKLERSDVGDTGNHSVDIEGGLQTNSEHLETTHEGVTPMKIVVTRGFGTGDSEAC